MVPAVIQLDVPARAQHLATVRVVAASAGVDAELDVDALDDVRLGVDELAALLIARVTGDARLRVVAHVRPGLLVIEGTIDGEVDPTVDPADALSERIVAAVVDRYELAERSFRLEKSAPDRGD